MTAYFSLALLTHCSGAGESGKSTIIKQMRIIHSRGFPEEERHQTRAIIYSNIVIAFKVLLDIMNSEEIDFENEEKIRVLPTHLPKRPTSANER